MLGPSGSGKTTTLKMIAGFEKPDAGTVELGGEDVSGLAPYARSVNTVFQDYALFPHMSVEENIEYGLTITQGAEGGTGEAARRGPRNGPARRPRRPQAERTVGGQRQRVALARAIVNRPRVLLLDEPLGALDLKLREQMQVELKQIQGEVGITFIYVTHDQDEALTMSDRIAVFNEGRIEQASSPRDLYEHPVNEFVAGFRRDLERDRTRRPETDHPPGEDPDRPGRDPGRRADHRNRPGRGDRLRRNGHPSESRPGKGGIRPGRACRTRNLKPSPVGESARR